MFFGGAFRFPCSTTVETQKIFILKKACGRNINVQHILNCFWLIEDKVNGTVICFGFVYLMVSRAVLVVPERDYREITVAFLTKMRFWYVPNCSVLFKYVAFEDTYTTIHVNHVSSRVILAGSAEQLETGMNLDS